MCEEISQSHIRCLQETSLAGETLHQLTSLLKHRGLRYQFTNTDPEAVRPLEVLGVIAQTFNVYALTPRTRQYQAIATNGRCQLVAVTLPGNVVLVIVQLYGWTGANQDPVAAGRTDDKLSVALHGLEQHPLGLKLIL